LIQATMKLLDPRRSFYALVTLLALASAVHAQLPSGTWQYHWGDDFTGSTLDTTKWSNGSPDWGMSTAAPTQIRQDHVLLGGGQLTLKASRVSEGGAEPFAGGIISSYQKVNISGGTNYIEARILLPNTPGAWPAFWGLYDGWPPEADIMEYPIDTAAGSGYNQDQYHTAFHYRNTSGGNSAGAGQVNPGSAGDLGGAYHTFGMEWREDDWVGFYFDGQRVSEFGDNAAIAQMQHMYLILNHAVGGWPGTPNTTEWPVGHSDEMKVDWVRVWKAGSSSTSNWNYTGMNTSAVWDTAGNWTNGAPNLGGITSSFGTASVATQNIDWTGRRTLSVMNFDGNTRYRFGTVGDRLVLGYGNGGSLAPSINLASTTTVEQEITADLEIAGGLTINNNSASPLILSGGILGDGGIRVRGVGATHFNGTGNYGGDTIVGPGQDPGIAIVRGQNAFGNLGRLVIGESGNSSTARVELENNSSIANNIAFRGRNNASASIVNNSGTNTLAGTLQLESGGSTYMLRSDAGVMHLTGKANGVSIGTLTNMSGRMVTLDGAGDGKIDGAIQNASGTTLAITKQNTGTWTLGGANTYSGTTTISQGTLVVDGTTGFGNTQVASGATLAGGGNVRGSLSAQWGSTVRVGGAGIPLVSTSGFAEIDNFQTYPTGQIGTTPNTTGNAWTGVFNGTANAEITTSSGNSALAVRGTNAASGWRGAVTNLVDNHEDDFSLASGETGTYFFRVRRTGSGNIDAVFGLTDLEATTSTAPGSDTADPWNEYATMLSIAGSSASSSLRAFSTGAGDVALTSMPNNQWTNVWLTVDNAAKTFRVATSTGNSDGTLAPQTFQFGRRTGATVGTNPLVTFGIHEALGSPVEFDDFYFTQGSELSNPLLDTLVPDGELLTISGNFQQSPTTTLEIDLYDTTAHDRLVVGGAWTVGGTLSVQLDPTAPALALGNTFDLFYFDTVTGAFSNIVLPELTAGLHWDTSNLLVNGVLAIVAGIEGDYNNDGMVNLADYTVWRDNLGAAAGTLPNDPHNGVIGSEQYETWKANFGQSLDQLSTASTTSVPEPSAFVLLLLTAMMLLRRVPQN
jgi:autotransporter-associated beta strand protein